MADRARAGDLRLPAAVRDMRTALGLSRDVFARVLKLTRRQLTEIERGNPPRVRTSCRWYYSPFGGLPDEKL